MSREILITTPENIAIEYELAGLGSRAAAYTIDLMFKFVCWLSIGVAGLIIMGVAVLVGWHWFQRFVADFLQIIAAVYVIIAFLILWGYGILFEIIWNGQTPGKRQMGIRVIRLEGYPLGVFGATIRNLLWIVDFLPAAFLAGIVSILVTREYQRLGDLVAGTIVVKQRAPQSLDALLQVARITPEHLDKDALELISSQADRMSPDEYRAVRHFTERRMQLDPVIQRRQAALIALPLMHRLDIVPPSTAKTVDYANFLEYLAVAYEQLRRPK
ncbi:MAG: RDD family protein [Capsulimonadaceae bacterium]|nr:RDD family protein [Capsulimonadaceae bacterium]